MKASPSRSAPGRFIAWCKQEQASIQQQLELMETGKVLTGENRGSGWVDTTAELMERGSPRGDVDFFMPIIASALRSKRTDRFGATGN